MTRDSIEEDLRVSEIMRGGEGKGRIARPLPMDQLWIPAEIRTDGQFLIFRGDNSDRRELTGGSKDLLVEFAKLASEPEAEFADRVVTFAKQWGPLGPCHSEHGLWHTREARPVPMPGTNPQNFPIGEWGEPLSAWRTLARRTRALLGASALLRLGETVRPDLIAEFPHDDQTGKMSIGGQRVWVATILRSWLQDAGVRLVPRWFEADRLEVALTQNGVFGAVAAQLMLAARGSGAMYLCDTCPNIFFADRKRNSARGVYCDACGKKKKDAKASERYRRKKHQADSPSSGKPKMRVARAAEPRR